MTTNTTFAADPSLAPSYADDGFEHEFDPLAAVSTSEVPSVYVSDPEEDEQEAKGESEAAPEALTEKTDTNAETAEAEKDKQKLDPDELTEQYSRKFLQLSKRDKEIREKSQSLEARDAELAKRDAELREVEEFKQRVLNDPLKTIIELGIDPDQIYAKKMELEAQRPVLEIKNEIQALREELGMLKQERQTEAEQRAKLERETHIRSEGQKWESEYAQCMDDEDYRIVKAWDPDGEIVREYALEEYKKTGKLLPAREAVSIIRDGIAEKAQALAALGMFGAQVTSKDAQDSANALVRSKSNKSPSVTKTISSTRAVDSPSRALPNIYDEDAEMERIIAKYS